jgi:hypothetical protein
VWSLAEALARVRWLDVLPPGASTAETSTYRVRLTRPGGASAPLYIELVELESQRVLWIESLHPARSGADAFGRIAAVLEWQIGLAEHRRTRDLDEGLLGVDALVHRAISRVRTMTAEGLDAGERLLARALEIDRRAGRAHAYQALTQLFRVAQDATPDPAGARDRARLHAREATELAPDDGWAWAIRGHVEAFLFRRHAEGLPLIDHGLRLHPSSGLMWSFSANHRGYIGDFDRARSDSERAQQLTDVAENPFQCLIGAIGAAVCAAAGNYRGALARARRVVADSPNFIAAYPPLLASLGQLGESAEAERHAARLREYLPDLSLDHLAQLFPLVRQVSSYARGIEKAGIPRR